MNTNSTWFVSRAILAFLVLWTSASFAAEEVKERAVPMFPQMQPNPSLAGAARSGGTAIGGAAWWRGGCTSLH